MISSGKVNGKNPILLWVNIYYYYHYISFSSIPSAREEEYNFVFKPVPIWFRAGDAKKSNTRGTIKSRTCQLLPPTTDVLFFVTSLSPSYEPFLCRCLLLKRLKAILCNVSVGGRRFSRRCDSSGLNGEALTFLQ